MKKLALFPFLLLSHLTASAQFELEHTYDSAATYNFCPPAGESQLMYIHFESSGERYVRINRCGKLMSLYDMEHNLVKHIDLDALYTSAPYFTLGSIMYISENLFNLDDKLEFMYVTDSGGFYITQVFNETGTLLFSEPGTPNIKLNLHLQQYPIYNTEYGTKLILSYQTGEAKVFGLAGTLTTEIEMANNELSAQAVTLSNPYPNPADNYTTIDYTLSEGTSTAELVLFALNGVEVGRYSISNAFTSIDIPTATLQSGTYYFELQTETGIAPGKKLIVIR